MLSVDEDYVDYETDSILVQFTDIDFKHEIKKIKELDNETLLNEIKTFEFLEEFIQNWLYDVAAKMFAEEKTFINEKYGFDIEEYGTEITPKKNKVYINIILNRNLTDKYDLNFHKQIEDKFIEYFTQNFKTQIINFYLQSC